MARRIADYAWVSDGVTPTERGVLGALRTLIDWDVTIGRRVASYGWVVDGITANEEAALETLRRIGEDRLGLDELTGESWIVDGMTEAEWRRLDDLYRDVQAQRDAQP